MIKKYKIIKGGMADVISNPLMGKMNDLNIKFKKDLNDVFNDETINNKKIPMPKLDNNKTIFSMNNKCGPVFGFVEGSCIPLSILQQIADEYNKNVNDNNKIKTLRDIEIKENNLEDYKLYLVNELQIALGKNQKEWYENKLLKNLNSEIVDILKKSIFRPEGPDKQFEWMDSVRMKIVMKQYEDLYHKFKFLSCVPLDFENFPSVYKLTNIDYEKLENEGKTRFGIIINSDRHTGGGQHWFMMFYDLEKGEIYFIDSCANPPARYGKEIDIFVNGIKNYLISKGFKEDEIVYKYNKIQHQYKNTECGVYSMYYILQFLKKKTFKEITENILSDDDVNEYRLIFFSNMPKQWKKSKKSIADN